MLASGAATIPIAKAQSSIVKIAYLRQQRPPLTPLSPLDQIAPDEGIAGARLGVADNATTGRFTGQGFALSEHLLAPGEQPDGIVRALTGRGVRFLVADLDREQLLSVAALGPPDLTVFNVRLPDDDLRGVDCRANLFHTAPSRAMQADALAQYLVWKSWRRWFLVVGPLSQDRLYAEALRRAAGKFGGVIVADKEWTFRPGGGRVDTGHVTLQTEIPSFTQGADHDVLVVADTADEFGEYLIGRTNRPRPVAGTHGITADGWSPVAEQWGARQVQGRFARLAGRRMNAVDYAAWLALRSIGEAALAAKSTDPAQIRQALDSPDFQVAGFKGRGQSFRPWDGQMRQPMLIAGPRLLLSVSPQPGFLHRRTELDTLGIDQEETRCRR